MTDILQTKSVHVHSTLTGFEMTHYKLSTITVRSHSIGGTGIGATLKQKCTTEMNRYARNYA